ncbi:uncharacterized protein LOC118279891 [Spodoptera frugiperda]|uniref:Uncharacterized protein LOC118279891 n=1 Tax=Spodoptera frugiperda TaxID=7108 RepID=A0A9R0DJ83_SPOFR|nr:uncharacterized protein LOC118279891 [Spodoptera frugiperda]
MPVLNTFTLHMTFFLISQCYFTTAMSTTAVTEASKTKTRVSSFDHNIINKLFPSDDVKCAGNTDKINRYKRQGPAGISPPAMIRLFLKLVKNLLFGQFEDINHPMSKQNVEPVLINMKKGYFPYMYEKDADTNGNQLYHGK